MTSNRHQPKKVRIRIDDTRLKAPAGDITGADVRALPDPPIPPDRDLYLDVDGGEDRLLADDDVVTLADRTAFYTADETGAHPREVPIVIDGARIEAVAIGVTGSTIRNLTTPAIPADRDLWRDMDGSPDERIEDDEIVTLTPRAEFYSVPREIAPG